MLHASPITANMAANQLDSFCRKTTLTKHARRSHTVRSENDPPIEESETEDESHNGRMRKDNGRQQWRKELKARRSHPMMHSQYIQQPMTPPSPGLSHSSISSRNSSFASDYGHTMTINGAPGIMHQPPTPQSPYYSVDDSLARSVSPHQQPEVYDAVTGAPLPPSTMAPTTMPSENPYENLRIVCSTPSPHQLLAAQQSMANSPGGLSNCSSATSATSDSYFYRSHPSHPGSYVNSPVTPVSMPYSTGPVMQQQWIDYPPYQQHQMIVPPQEQPRIYYAHDPNMAYIKQEPQMMAPAPRSYC